VAIAITFKCTPRAPVSLSQLRELHWFRLWAFECLLGTVKFFEHTDVANLTLAWGKEVLCQPGMDGVIQHRHV
jgi:hypothetical protein